MMTMHNLTKHLPEGSIFVVYIDECCLHHDDEYNGEEKMVSGHLFYVPTEKAFYFFSVFVVPHTLPSHDYTEEHALHISTAIEGFDPQNPTDEQANVALYNRYECSIEDGDVCRLEDIWFVNDESQMKHTKTIPL